MKAELANAELRTNAELLGGRVPTNGNRTKLDQTKRGEPAVPVTVHLGTCGTAQEPKACGWTVVVAPAV